MDGRKKRFRRELRARRRALSGESVEAAGAAVAEAVAGLAPYRGAATVLAYWATENEVPTDRLIERARADGKEVYLPGVAADALEFRRYSPAEPLRPGEFGIPAPTGALLRPEQLDSCIAFLPLVAWDSAGNRLGRGKGYYDRAFSPLRERVCLVGLAYDFQHLACVPHGPTDVPMHYVVTEHGVVCCGDRSDPVPTLKEDGQTNGLHDDSGQRGAGRGAGVGARPAAAAPREG